MSLPLWLRCGISNHASFYHFLLWESTRSRSEGSTLQDLLIDLRHDHAETCGCDVFVEARAWLACLEVDQESTIGLDTSTFSECPLDTSLTSLSTFLKDSPGAVHILFEGKSDTTSSTVAIDKSLKRGAYFKHAKGMVFRTPGADCRLPVGEDVRFSDMCRTPGLLIVDKSLFISPYYTQPDRSRLPLIRRPKGFGKTTFLSMLESWCDISGNNDIHPSLNSSELSSKADCQPGCALIFHLDLAALRVSPEMSDDVIRLACRAFLDAAARDCYRRYADQLRYREGSYKESRVISALFARDCSHYSATADYTRMGRQLASVIPGLAGKNMTPEMVDGVLVEEYTFEVLLDEVSQRKYQIGHLFVGVDNYTAPLIVLGQSPHYESILVEGIFKPIFRSIKSNTVCRALMVGDSDLLNAQVQPYCTNSLFRKSTHDLTHTFGARKPCGFTESELIAYDQALFRGQGDFLAQIKAKAQSSVRDSNNVTASDISYSMHDVLAYAQALRSLPNDQAALSSIIIRTFIEKSAFEESQDSLHQAPSLADRKHTVESSPNSTKRKQMDEDAKSEASSETDVSETWSESPSLSVQWTSPRPSPTSSLSSLQTKVNPALDGSEKLFKYESLSGDDVLRPDFDATAGSHHVSPQLSTSSAPHMSHPPSPTPSRKRQRLSQ